MRRPGTRIVERMPASESTARSASADSRRDSVAIRVSRPVVGGRRRAALPAVAGAERPAHEQRQQAEDDERDRRPHQVVQAAARPDRHGALPPYPIECATGHTAVRPGRGLLPAGNRPRLRGHAVPFIAEGARPPLGHAHLRRPLLAGRVQRPVPAQPVEGPDRPVGRLRPADADRLRPRRRARRRRGRQGRRPGHAHRRHARAVRRHPARRDEHVDDDQRHRDVAARALPGGRRGARARRHASSPGRRRTTSSRSTCRGGPTSSRRRRRCG